MVASSIALSPVRSSAIKALGHSGEVLAVQYMSGKVFHFNGVSVEQYAECLCCKSVGSSIIKLVKGLTGIPYLKEE